MSLISASCSLDGRALAAKAAKARENVDSLGTSPACCQPHRRRSILSADSISISRLVVGKLNTAFATKARASAARSDGGRPASPLQAGQQHLDPRHSQDADRLLVVSAQRAARRILDRGRSSP